MLRQPLDAARRRSPSGSERIGDNDHHQVRHYTKLFRAQRSDCPIQECYWDARRHEHFMRTVKANLAKAAKRSRAAKKAAKTRRDRRL